MLGRNVTMKSRLTHHVECVRAAMSAVSAIVAGVRPDAGAERREEEQPETCALPKTAARLRIGAERRHARASTRPSAPANSSSSSGVPTDTRIAVGAPKPASGRTITPSWSRRSNSSTASLPVST